jgi:hypothetical protein
VNSFWTHFDTLCLSWFHVDVHGKLGTVRWYPYSIYMRGNSELILKTTFWTHFDTLCQPWFHVDVHGKLGTVRWYPYSIYMRGNSELILDTF